MTRSHALEYVTAKVKIKARIGTGLASRKVFVMKIFYLNLLRPLI